MNNGQIELPDDIARETFILAWRNIRQFRHKANFPPGFIGLRLMAGKQNTKKHEALLTSEIMAEPDAAYVLGVPLGIVNTSILKTKEKMRTSLGAYEEQKAANAA